MLTKGPAKKVTIFVNEDTQHHMTALHDSIVTFLMRKGISGATATRAFSGFGSHQMLHTSRVEALVEHLPIRIEFVDSPRSFPSNEPRAKPNCCECSLVRRTNGMTNLSTRPSCRSSG